MKECAERVLLVLLRDAWRRSARRSTARLSEQVRTARRKRPTGRTGETSALLRLEDLRGTLGPVPATTEIYGGERGREPALAVAETAGLQRFALARPSPREARQALSLAARRRMTDTDAKGHPLTWPKG